MPKVRRALYLQLATFAAAIVLLLVLSRFFPLVDLVAEAQQRVIDLGAWSAVCYPLLFAACNVLLLPGGVLSVGGGFFFGLWWGFFIVLLGNSIGAAISFVLSRWLGQRWLSRKLSRNPTLRLLEPAVEREGWKIIFLSQLHPLFPTSLLNYLYGLTRIPFRTYMVWTSIGRAPGIFLYVYLGTLGQFGLNMARGKSHPRVVEYWIWGGAFITTALLFALLTRIALRAIQKSPAISNSRAEEHSAEEMLSYK
ncbi:MAG TPA: VTT domain-containing protein [Chthoniobacterales bacterium]|nr:VTT domain-containing protein [Chthoniobacterales bacterium]